MPVKLVLESEKYQIIQELGRGGMGVVYLAEDTLLKRTVALKVLHEYLNRDSSFVVRFQKEARSVSSLRHPNIVFVHGLEAAGNSFLIDMEYVDGLSLDKFVRSRVVAPPVVARIAEDILSGLDACHAMGVIHRDIKPANILLDQDGVAKIADFGLATAYAGHLLDSVNSGTASGFFMGTPRYAPPAAWEGLKPVPQWDLYSLGVILYELLSGRVAFPGDAPMSIMRQHLTSPLPPLSEAAPQVSPALARLVDSLVAEGGSGSSARAADVLRALQETREYATFQEGDTASTVKVALRRKAISHRVRRYKPDMRKSLYAAAALVLVAAAGVWVATRGAVERDAPALPAVADVLLGTSPAFLRPAVVGAAEPENAIWMFSRELDGGPAQIIALDELGFRCLTLEPGAGEGLFAIRGDWGEYLTPAAGSIRYGTLEGSAMLGADRSSLSLSLDQINARDGSRMPFHILARPLEFPLDRPQFVQLVESNPAAQSLLYNELLPRDLAWARELEALMPSFAPGRLGVNRTDAAIELDGILDEEAWHQPLLSGEDITTGPIQGLRGLWSSEAVILGFEAGPVPSGVRLDIVLRTGWESASGTPVKFLVSVHSDGTIAGQYRVGTLDMPWDCDWAIADTIQDEHWKAEVRIPLTQFNTLAKPEVGRRWRMNSSLRDETNGELITYWGYENTDAVEHGVVMIFEGEAE